MPDYQIDTIPVWDAYHENGECPLCAIYKKCDEQFTQSALGGSVMDPDTRIAVNQKGYCQRHNQQLFALKNKLGLALMTHTHLLDVLSEMQSYADQLGAALEQEETASAAVRAVRRVAKNAPSLQIEKDMASAAKTRTETCLLCEKLEDVMARYTDTVVAMWKQETEFRKTFSESKGYCMEHFASLLEKGGEKLTGKDQRLFMKSLLDTQMAGMKRVAQDLEWFTLKFDYRNQDKPWGNSVDAPERAINKLRGRCITPQEERKPESK